MNEIAMKKTSIIVLVLVLLATMLIHPLLPVALTAATALGYLCIAQPEISLVISFFAGRFNNFLIAQAGDWPIYISLFSILFVFYGVLLRREKVHIQAIGFHVLNILLLVVMLGSMFLYKSPYGTNKVIEYGMYVLLVVLLADALLKNRARLWKLVRMMYVLTLVFAILSLAYAAANGSLLSGRMSIPGGGSNVFGRFMVYGLLSGITLLMCKKLRPIHYGSLAIFAMCLFFSGSRQAMLGGVLAAAVALGIFFSKQKMAQKARFLSAFAVLAVIAAALLVKYADKIMQATGVLRFMLLFDEDKGTSVNARVSMIDQGVHLAGEKFMFGRGIGSFESFFPYFRYPHNIFVELYFELGLAGLVLFGLILGYLLAVSLRHVFKEGLSELGILNIGFLSMLIFSIFTAQISGDMYDNRWIWFMGIILIKIHFFIENEKRRDERSDESKNARLN